jgi:hypothetical protein
MEENLQKRIEETLNSWDGAQRAAVKPFLHTRVMAKLAAKKETKSGWIPSLLARPMVAVAMICAVLAVNGWFLFGGKKEEGARPGDTEQTVSALITDYNLENSYTYTDINE